MTLCQNPMILSCVKTRVFVCDGEIAAKCRMYRCRNTEGSVSEDFDEVLRSPARCGQEYPKLAVLLWCLQDVSVQGRLARFKEALGRLGANFLRLITLTWW